MWTTPWGAACPTALPKSGFGRRLTHLDATGTRLLLTPVEQVTAKVLAAFPPRGGIRLLPREQTQKAGLHSLDHLIAQQLVLDTVHFFDGDRVQCARRLAHGMHLLLHSRAL